MGPIERHHETADDRFDGGDMDCGSGLLLHLRAHLDRLRPGQLLEILSTEISVEEDLPAWCRLTGNDLVSWTRDGKQRSFLLSKGSFVLRAPVRGAEPNAATSSPLSLAAADLVAVPVFIPDSLPPPAPAPPIPALAVLGIGSWPRPRWMVQAIHDHDEGRLDDADFDATAEDAVRLAMAAQEAAGVDVLSDGEQRRDSYANFVGSRLDNVKRIPLVDLLPLVDEPEKLRAQFDSLDVPASVVRHPALFGKLSRRRPIAAHELAFARGVTALPIKIAIPGPYLLTRILWMECLVDRPYESREELGQDIVRVLREEIHFLLAGGAALVQLDEPVLTEVVFGAPPSKGPVFMCGALSEKKAIPEELAFAQELLAATLAGLPRERMALHVCRGNWTPDEGAALRGDYRALLPTLSGLAVGTVFLELCTPRAGEMEVLRALPDDMRVGVGVVNPKRQDAEPVDEIAAKAREAIRLFGRDRVLLNPDCGFATFADNPVASARVAEEKMRAIVAARDQVRAGN